MKSAISLGIALLLSSCLSMAVKAETTTLTTTKVSNTSSTACEYKQYKPHKRHPRARDYYYRDYCLDNDDPYACRPDPVLYPENFYECWTDYQYNGRQNSARVDVCEP